MSEFHFLRPGWLLALLPAAVLAWHALRARHRQAGGWSSLIDPALLPALLRGPATAPADRLPFALLWAGWLLASLALAGPAWERLPEPVHRSGDALVIALDLSLSMQAADLTPSRLERARFKLRDLLQQRRDGYTALIAWAGDAHVVTPLSDDTATVAALLEALDPSIMPESGSDPVAAVRLAGELLAGAGLDGGRVLLVADSLDGAQAKAIAPLLRQHGMTLSVLAVGTAAGAPVTLPGGGFAREADGSIAVPALDAAGMRAATAAAGGLFAELRLDDGDLRHLLPPPEALAKARTDVAERRFDQWLDRAPWLACLLLPLAALAFRRGWLLVLPLALLMAPPRAQAFEWQDLWLTRDQQGARALAEGDAARAAERFRSPDWRGAAAYQGGDFEASAQAFAQSGGAAADYNRGNALARAGKLQDALAAYDAALAAQPEMEDARQNRKLVEELLDQQQDKPGGQQGQQGQQQQQQQQPGQDPGQQNPTDSGQQGPSDGAPQGQPGSAPPGKPEEHGGADSPAEPEAGSDNPPGTGPRDSDTAQGKDGKAADGEADATPRSSGSAQRDAETARTDGEPAPGDERARERAQALEQWLRQVPDDPGELLRRKFEYESRLRRAAAPEDE